MRCLFRRYRRCGLLFVGMLLLNALGACGVQAHDSRPVYLAVTEIHPQVYQTLWKLPLKLGKPLAVMPIFPEHCQPSSAANMQLRSASSVTHVVLRCEQPLDGERIRFSGVESMLTDVLIQVSLLSGLQQTDIVSGRDAAFTIVAQNRGWRVAWQYILLGIEHILIGIDHLLFVLCLLLMVRHIPMLIKTITAFTLAHSITLALAAMQWVSLPQAPVEAMIALSIVFLCCEWIKAKRGLYSLTADKPWLVALVFGLLHGLGFAGALAEIGLPQDQILAALLSFNIGVELGQLLFVFTVLVLRHVFLLWLPAMQLPRLASLSVYVVGAIASFWVVERVSGF